MRYRAIALFLAVLACANVLSTQSASAGSAEKSKEAQQPDTSKKSPPKKSPPTLGDYFEARVERPFGRARSSQEIVQDLGNPLPFKLIVGRDDAIMVYCHAASLSACDSKLLDKIKADIASLFDNRPEVIKLEHSKYVPDIVKAAQELNYSGITIEAAGPDAIQVTRTVAVSDDEYRDFKRALRNLVWRFQPHAPASRVYYLPASDAAKALSGGTSTDQSDKSGASEGGAAAVTAQNPAASNVGPCPAGAKSDSSEKADSSGNSDGSDSDAAKEDSSGKSGSVGETASGCPPKTAAASDKGNDAKSKDSSKPPVSVAAVDGDELVFSDNNPGDDAQIAQKQRVLALIDFPRPEVLINTFSFQASSSDSKVLADADAELQRAVGNFNVAFQLGLSRAWRYLQGQIDGGEFFDPTLYDYLTQRFVANSVVGPLTESLQLDRSKVNICAENRYCLGYTSLFNPLRPSLTDMLLAVLVSKDPITQFPIAIAQMQNFHFREKAPPGLSDLRQGWESQDCEKRDIAVWNHSTSGLFFPLYCFADFVQDAYLTGGMDNLGGPLRAALVNFLFQYKMSQQYPQEFSGFELSQTAQELNSQLNPLIVAFNRDLAAALGPIKRGLDPNLTPNGWFGWSGHGSKFVDNGLVTVRTVSGKETIVDTETQSFFDVTNAPSITDVINSVKSAESGVPKVLKTNLTANEAAVIIGALNSVQPATSQVGRQFKIDITPHSLTGASSAELEIKLTSGDSAAPTRYSGGKTAADNISRVAKNTIETKVRLESIKLFEISSLTAVVRQSRHNFPLLPPFVEIPYINSFIGFPVPGAKEYHRSVAVMSAAVVPTAADLASDVVFSQDRVLFPGEHGLAGQQSCTNASGRTVPCVTKRALSLHDFSGHSISEFNKKMASCFAKPVPEKPCGKITFDDLLPEE